MKSGGDPQVHEQPEAAIAELEARPRDPPDAVPLRRFQNRGNGKNLYRGPTYKEIKLTLSPRDDNPENWVGGAQVPRHAERCELKFYSSGAYSRAASIEIRAAQVETAGGAAQFAAMFFKFRRTGGANP
jgi:hypothetical protein